MTSDEPSARRKRWGWPRGSLRGPGGFVASASIFSVLFGLLQLIEALTPDGRESAAEHVVVAAIFLGLGAMGFLLLRRNWANWGPDDRG